MNATATKSPEFREWETRQRDYRRLEEIDDAYFAAKYPQPKEEKSAPEASQGRSFDRRWRA